LTSIIHPSAGLLNQLVFDDEVCQREWRSVANLKSTS